MFQKDHVGGNDICSSREKEKLLTMSHQWLSSFNSGLKHFKPNYLYMQKTDNPKLTPEAWFDQFSALISASKKNQWSALNGIMPLCWILL